MFLFEVIYATSAGPSHAFQEKPKKQNIVVSGASNGVYNSFAVNYFWEPCT